MHSLRLKLPVQVGRLLSSYHQRVPFGSLVYPIIGGAILLAIAAIPLIGRLLRRLDGD